MSRLPTEQTEHDLVLEKSANTYLGVTGAKNIFINPGKQKNHYLSMNKKPLYPDIIVRLPNGKIVLEEIETTGSVNKNEAQEQWLKFCNLADQFKVVVPLSQLNKAGLLLKELGIESKTVLQGYYFDRLSGEVRFTG